MDNPIVKVVIGIVVVLVALPVVMKLIPEPVTFARAQSAFEAAGLAVTGFRESAPGGNESIAQADMSVGGASVTIYQYDNEGKIVVYEGYQKQDPGQAIVAGWGLAESLGAAVQKPIPHAFKRKGMFLIVATSEDQELNKRICEIFSTL